MLMFLTMVFFTQFIEINFKHTMNTTIGTGITANLHPLV